MKFISIQVPEFTCRRCSRTAPMTPQQLQRLSPKNKTMLGALEAKDDTGGIWRALATNPEGWITSPSGEGVICAHCVAEWKILATEFMIMSEDVPEPERKSNNIIMFQPPKNIAEPIPGRVAGGQNAYSIPSPVAPTSSTRHSAPIQVEAKNVFQSVVHHTNAPSTFATSKPIVSQPNVAPTPVKADKPPETTQIQKESAMQVSVPMLLQTAVRAGAPIPTAALPTSTIRHTEKAAPRTMSTMVPVQVKQPVRPMQMKEAEQNKAKPIPSAPTKTQRIIEGE